MYVKWTSELRLVLYRWLAEVSSRCKVQHRRPGQRSVVIRLMCSGVRRRLVVQELSSLQPERSLPASCSNWRCHVGGLEEQLVLNEIHWDEDQTVLTVNHFIHLTSSHLSLSCIMISLLYVTQLNPIRLTLYCGIVFWMVDVYASNIELSV